ncbi:carbohydrate porin [Photorhabdus heterorhabditis]|uniref:carbohydrate porin n=1 Tax=Photorhabdus heterorhabditis TaxID=880156 RepID=UPI0009FB5060|nr:carbohydrate porin [Photorhabdus heterorhabditis]MBS9443852.1 carbohydrate porin [Photorhabdus heterorhabditis]NRN28390.1 carbohydrate porin [Photorhabdus heterorhabditis subsp. aluminescens]
MKIANKFVLSTLPLILLYSNINVAAESNCSSYDPLLPRGPETPSVASACDTVFPEWGGLRKEMADRGFYANFQMLTNLTYDLSRNWKNTPNPNYVGQRLTTGNFVSTELTYDLSRIGFSDKAQLRVGLNYAYNNFKNNGQDGHPFISAFSINQPLFNDRVILNYGYTTLLSHFYGLFLGSSTASSALGPTSVMLSQAGLPSTKPSPSIDIRFLSKNKRWYDHIGVARSQSSEGLKADSKYNTYGLRWKVPSAGTLIINELGYRVNADETESMIWIRGGSVFNKTPYFNYNNSKYEDYTYSHYIAATRQITKPDASMPFRGWYIDGKANYAPKDRNLFNADVSLSLFSIGLLNSRPNDMLTLGLSYNKFSDDAKDYFARNGQVAESYSATASASYSYRVSNGIYWTNSLSYTHHPSVTPKEDDAYNLLTQITFSL